MKLVFNLANNIITVTEYNWFELQFWNSLYKNIGLFMAQ